MERLIEWLGGADAVQSSLMIGALVAARVAPLTVIAPWIGLRAAPAQLRTGVIVALTLAFAPLAALSEVALPTSPLGMTVAITREALIGAVFAIATALPFHAIDWAGRLVDTWRGASLAEVIAPPTGERTSPLGDLQLMLGVAIFLTTGGHRAAFGAFAEGLLIAPVGSLVAPDLASVALGAASLCAAALALAISLAAPAAAAIVLVELSLGLVARSAPQVPVFFAGMPLRAATGIFAVLLALSLVVARLPDAFRDGLRVASEFLRAFGG